jgi:rubrerythrin
LGISRLKGVLNKIKPEDVDKKILRSTIIANLDAINLYDEMVAFAKNKHIKTVSLDVANEKKEHVSKFQTLLLTFDTEQVKALMEGKKEVEALTS